MLEFLFGNPVDKAVSDLTACLEKLKVVSDGRQKLAYQLSVQQRMAQNDADRASRISAKLAELLA